jgi:hypothetical protein
MEMILWIALFFFMLKMLTPDSVKTIKQCNIHKWVYKDPGDGNEFMICSVCNKRPGEAIDDGSEL